MSEEGRRQSAALHRVGRVHGPPEYRILDDELRTAYDLSVYLTELAAQGWRVHTFQVTDNGFGVLLERKVLPR